MKMENEIVWNANRPSKEACGSTSVEIEKDQNLSHGGENTRVNDQVTISNNKVVKPSIREIVAGSSQWFSKARKIMLTSME